MQIKVIYEEDALVPVKELLCTLDRHQLFFIEQHIQTLKQQRQETIFQQWLCTMQDILRAFS